MVFKVEVLLDFCLKIIMKTLILKLISLFIELQYNIRK